MRSSAVQSSIGLGLGLEALSNAAVADRFRREPAEAAAAVIVAGFYTM